MRACGRLSSWFSFGTFHSCSCRRLVRVVLLIWLDNSLSELFRQQCLSASSPSRPRPYSCFMQHLSQYSANRHPYRRSYSSLVMNPCRQSVVAALSTLAMYDLRNSHCCYCCSRVFLLRLLPVSIISTTTYHDDGYDDDSLLLRGLYNGSCALSLAPCKLCFVLCAVLRLDGDATPPTTTTTTTAGTSASTILLRLM